MKIVLAILVHNRFENLDHWLHCWDKCNKENTQLVVIHNTETENKEEMFFDLCKKHSVQYISRKNIGYDLGAFQDVCLKRLPGFPEWEHLLWCTDDVFPMALDFVQQFNSAMKPGIGVACMEISPYVKMHIRTTGFMIERKVANNLKFPADPITTKQDCYLFEHRSQRETFYEQVIQMGFQVVMVSDRADSPLWDIGYHRKLPRKNEHEKLFGTCPMPEDFEQKEKTTFICPIYKSFPAIISSLIMQTNQNWELKLIHDGPEDGNIQAFINSVNDDRIEYLESKKHVGNWGHIIRSEYLQKVKTKYVVITNPDNQYAPVFIEKCLHEFVKRSKVIAVYSAQMVHSYTDWKIINCRLQRGFIDCGGVMLKTKEAQQVGWNNVTDHSADWFFFNDISKKFGVQNFIPVPGVLFTHN